MNSPVGAKQATNREEGEALLREMTKRKVPLSVAIALQTIVIPKLEGHRFTMTYVWDDHSRKGPFVHIGIGGRPRAIDTIERQLMGVGFVRKDSWIDSSMSYDSHRNNPSRSTSLVDSWWARSR